jgi:hypothetical protein
MVESKGRRELQIRNYLWTLRSAKTCRGESGCTFPLVGRAFGYIQSGGASGLPGDDDVDATEGLRCSREYEEHARSCGMELVCGIPS